MNFVSFESVYIIFYFDKSKLTSHEAMIFSNAAKAINVAANGKRIMENQLDCMMEMLLSGYFSGALLKQYRYYFRINNQITYGHKSNKSILTKTGVDKD